MSVECSRLCTQETCTDAQHRRSISPSPRLPGSGRPHILRPPLPPRYNPRHNLAHLTTAGVEVIIGAGKTAVSHMVWRKRGNKLYRYHTIRENGRFRNLYIGSGAKAEQFLAELARARDERQAARDERRSLHDRVDRLDREFKDCDRLEAHTAALAHATLLAANYYLHQRSEWRTRHVRQDD